MTVSKVRADYEQLTEIARIFGQQAESAQRLLGALQQDMTTLQGGDWVGKGADRLYAEMTSAVLPAMGRVVRAMSEAASATTKISQVMKQAEDQSAALFRLDGIPEQDGVRIGSSGAAAGTLAAFGGGLAGPNDGGSGGTSGGSGDRPRTDPAPSKDPPNWDSRVKNQPAIRAARRDAYFKDRLAQSQSWTWDELKQHAGQRLAEKQRLVRRYADVKAESARQVAQRSWHDYQEWRFRNYNEWHELFDTYQANVEVDRQRALQLVIEASKKGTPSRVLNEMMGLAQEFRDMNFSKDTLRWQAEQEKVDPDPTGGKGGP